MKGDPLDYGMEWSFLAQSVVPHIIVYINVLLKFCQAESGVSSRDKKRCLRS